MRHRSQELEISIATLNCILTRNLHPYAYKNQLSQQLLPTDYAELATCNIESEKVSADFVDKSILREEAYFQIPNIEVRN